MDEEGEDLCRYLIVGCYLLVWPLPCQVRLLGRSKNLIKKHVLGFEGGEGTGLYIYLLCILPGSTPSCVPLLSFFLLFIYLLDGITIT
ncbi:hypothetical protein OIU84_016949 [Salix udensis]|uniref:Uncharacterized protein n=1 Tax=Salix udensis TaxID=889485 RepID=A0AAD6NQX7_9ROSI|nr:hypothetical protein OIU84_016949 [Salix udensis]